jgi:hypothetical protein
MGQTNTREAKKKLPAPTTPAPTTTAHTATGDVKREQGNAPSASWVDQHVQKQKASDRKRCVYVRVCM